MMTSSQELRYCLPIEASLLLMPDVYPQVGEWQRYVRPTVNPTLDPFCTQLTGITQAQVNNAQVLGRVWLMMLL
jgi:inhibitor of KinA sporulation pathway (predicted exonuclease)